MILYFSATGNTRFIAKELGRILEDKVEDICPRIRQHDSEVIYSEKPFIFCAPTYVCEAPKFFYDFLRRTEFTGSRDVYFISTNGGYSGISGSIAGQIIRKKHMHYRGCAEFKMPANYIANKSHKDSEPSEIEERIDQARQKIVTTAGAIKTGQRLQTRHIWATEYLIDYLLNPMLSRIGHRVKGFHVKDNCVSCGICEKKCPLRIISLNEGKPSWSGKTCAHCMDCIQNCPVEAIEYKDITQGRKRYRLNA